MKSLFVVLLAAVLAACSGAGQMMRSTPANGPKTVYFERVNVDPYGVSNAMEMALARAGYDPVSDKSRARYELKYSFNFDPYSMTAIMRIVDASTGDSIYFGEGKNRGFGTMMNPASSMAGCIERAFSELK